MKAIVQHRYGGADALCFEDIPEPAVGDRQVLVRVVAAGFDRGSYHPMRGLPYLVRLVRCLRRPRKRVPGTISPASSERSALRSRTPSPATRSTRTGEGTFVRVQRRQRGPRCAETRCPHVRKGRRPPLRGDHVVDYTRFDFASGERRYDVILDVAGNSKLGCLRHALTRRGALVIHRAASTPGRRPAALAVRARATRHVHSQRTRRHRPVSQRTHRHGSGQAGDGPLHPPGPRRRRHRRPRRPQHPRTARTHALKGDT